MRIRFKEGGFQGINGVAAWMGWPDSPEYAERELQYLAEEIASLDEVLTSLEKDPQRELVLDTTGSVIYTGNNLLFRLRKLMTVVYLAASNEEHELLIQRYLKDPKPVLWRGAFQPRNGEDPHDTVARCYPVLLAARRQGYQALAHCTIPVAEPLGHAEVGYGIVRLPNQGLAIAIERRMIILTLEIEITDLDVFQSLVRIPGVEFLHIAGGVFFVRAGNFRAAVRVVLGVVLRRAQVNASLAAGTFAGFLIPV